MFDIGGVELLLVAAVAILVVGPRELPGMLRSIGKVVRQARQMTSSVQRQFNDALKEAELDEVKKTFDDVRALNPATQIRNTIAKEMKPLTDVGNSLTSSADEATRMAKPSTADTAAKGTPAQSKAAKPMASPKPASPKPASQKSASSKPETAAAEAPAPSETSHGG